MKVRYVPRLAVDRDDLERSTGRKVAGGGPDSLRVIDVDEDEATMVVAAVAQLMDRTGTSAKDVTRLHVAGVRDKVSLPTIGQALFGDPDRVIGERLAEEPSDPQGVVHAEVEAVRPGSPRLMQGASAFAEAWLADGHDASADVDDRWPVLTLGADQAVRLGSGEAQAPHAVPMGAYVPEATWAQHSDARYRLLVSTCHENHSHFPPRQRCSECAGTTAPTPISRRGRVHTFTVISAGGGPSEFDFLHAAWGSYATMVVEPDGVAGVRVPGILADAPADSLEIGTPVEAVFRRLYGMQGRWRYGMKFRPDRE